MSVEANLLATQLGALGRDLDSETHLLAVFEDQATTLEGRYRRLKEQHGDEVAKAFLAARGSNADARNAEARLATVESRNIMLDVQDEWEKAKSLLRMQASSISTLKVRIDVGRSLLSNAKVEASLVYAGVDLYGTMRMLCLQSDFYRAYGVR